MRQSFVDFAHLKRVVSLTAILDHYHLLQGLKPSGQTLVGACPLHGGRNRRAFVVDPGTVQFLSHF